MNKQKHLHYFILMAIVLLLFKNIGNSQIALCKSAISVSTDPWSCSYTLLPSDINNGSSDYDILAIDKSNLTFLGQNLVTLTASKNSGQSSTCTCIVNLLDKAAPVAIVNQIVTIGLNDQNEVNLVPSMIDAGSYDHCSGVQLSVTPTLINCSSDNPQKVILTVTDSAGNFNQAISYINIVQNKNRVKALTCKGNITFGVPHMGLFEITADSLLEGGPYGCPAYYEVELKYNNISLPQPKVGLADVGKTFDYIVKDPETQNSCFGKITIIALDCTNSFKVCDTKSRCTQEGDCNSGHTLADDIEWPCDITIENAPSYLYINPSPEKIANYLKIPVSQIKPILFNGLPNKNKCLQISESYHTDVFESQNEIRFIYSVSNWLDLNGITYSFTQVINLIPNNNDLTCYVCDNKPWNTPFGDCASGHSMNDFVEWPADISVDFLEVSPFDLSLNPLIHPNDVAPQFNDSCNVTWLKTYSDQVFEINSSSYLIERTWSILNTKSLLVYPYIQKITVNAPVANNRNVCFSTIHNIPISNVAVTSNIVSGLEGCLTVSHDGSTNEIKPYKNDSDFQTGLDIEDLIILKESVLRKEPLNDMQKSAADMNADTEIGIEDINILNNLLTNEITSSPFYQTPWKFILANNFYYKNTLNDAIEIGSPFERYHFKGMKIGDLNDSYNRDEGITKISSFELEDQILNKGETYAVKTFNAEDLRIKGFQMTIAKNEAFEIVDVLSPFLKLNLVDKGDHYIIIGIVDDVYVIGDGLALENQTSMLKLIIKAKQNVVLHNVLKLHDSGNKIVSRSNRDLSSIQLNFNGSIPTNAINLIETNIQIFPNPTTGIVFIEGNETINSIRIMSFDGKTIQSIPVMPTGKLDLSHLPNGFYVVNLLMNNGINVAKKLIKI